MHGKAGLGKVRPGAARVPMALVVVSANGGVEWKGRARRGTAGRGMAWLPMGDLQFDLNIQCRKADKMEKKQWEEDPEIAARVELLKKITADYQRGHVLLWEVAEAALGMDRNDDRLQYAVKKWRKYCHSELSIETWGIPGQGVKLLTESEQVSMLPQKRSKRAYRQHGLILRSIRNTNIANLSEHERRMAAAIIEHSRAARRDTNKVTNTTRGKIPNDRQALIERAKQAAKESS